MSLHRSSGGYFFAFESLNVNIWAQMISYEMIMSVDILFIL